MTDSVGGWNEGRGILMGCAVSVGIALGPERSTELLESRVHEVHMRG